MYGGRIVVWLWSGLSTIVVGLTRQAVARIDRQGRAVNAKKKGLSHKKSYAPGN